jgi:flagellar hook-associated protein 2
MSLIEIAEAINLAKGTSGVQASVVKVTANDYRLVLSGVDTGTTIAASAVSGDDVFGELGVLGADGAFANELQEAKQAIIEIDDIQITRLSNQIDDVLDGTTLYLYQTTPTDTSITLEVGADVSSVKSGIVALLDAYNAYREFAVSQQTLPSSSSESVLFGDGTLRSINLAVGTALTSVIDSQSLALLGVTVDENNYLEHDEDVLDNLLLTDLEAVKSLLAFQMTASNKNLQLLARGSSVPPDFTLDITVDAAGGISDVSVGGQSGLFTISGTRIIGATGSPYEGFTFVYSSSNSSSVNVSFSTGIAEQLYNIANGATNSSSGTLTSLTSDLEDYHDSLTSRSDTIRDRAETYRTNLTARYAQYQAAIATAEAMQDYLTSPIDTWNASS